jgi:signal recognition particle subunit SRP19
MGKKGGNRGVRIKQMGPKGAGKMFNPMDDLAIPQEEMINLPPPPDRKYQIFWPIRKSYLSLRPREGEECMLLLVPHIIYLAHCCYCYCYCCFSEETFSMDAADFNVIYPSYLDSNKTIAQGRRIGQEVAVEEPTVSDISQALQSLNIRHVLQPHKGYPRDIETLWDNPGRVKVDLKNTPNEFDSKRALLKELAQIIPTLPTRQQRLEQAKQIALLEEQKAEEESQKSQQNQKLLQQQQQQQQQQQSASGGKTTNKKKGKKKR